jgi:hypothetical protein
VSLLSKVEIIEAYCDPRDSKAYLEPGDEASGKLYTSPDKDYSQPYTTGEYPYRLLHEVQSYIEFLGFHNGDASSRGLLGCDVM